MPYIDFIYNLFGGNIDGLDLLPQEALQEQCRIFTEGLETHERDGWMLKSEEYLLEHGLEHLKQWLSGNKIDADTGDDHLSHLISNLLMLRSNKLSGRIA
jgi:hypothetical protein